MVTYMLNIGQDSCTLDNKGKIHTNRNFSIFALHRPSTPILETTESSNRNRVHRRSPGSNPNMRTPWGCLAYNVPAFGGTATSLKASNCTIRIVFKGLRTFFIS